MPNLIDRCYDCGGLKKGAPRGYETMDLAACSCELAPKIPVKPKPEGKPNA